MSITKDLDLGSSSGTGSASLSVPAGGISAASDKIIVVRAVTPLTTANITASDQAGNSYGTPLLQDQDGSIAWCTSAILAAIVANPLSQGQTITAAGGGAQSMMMHGAVFSGVTKTLDSGGGTSSYNGPYGLVWSTFNGAGLVTSDTDDLLLCLAGIGANVGGTSHTPATNFTDEMTMPPLTAGARAIWAQYRIVSAAGTYKGGGTFVGGANTNTDGLMVALKASTPPSNVTALTLAFG